MSGNTRGKLKEHFEGVHRNLDWSIHHLVASTALIEATLRQTGEFVAVEGDEEKEQAFFMANAVYKAVIGIAEGIKVFDGLAQDIYGNI